MSDPCLCCWNLPAECEVPHNEHKVCCFCSQAKGVPHRVKMKIIRTYSKDDIKALASKDCQECSGEGFMSFGKGKGLCNCVELPHEGS